jgi:tripartite-type tricarboxylate transporter receptor subunit TctC
MTLRRSRFLALFAVAAATAAAPAWSQATFANWPERAITVVVPWPPGGFTDKLGRLMAEKMAASFGKPVVVQNMPGASAGIGSEHVMRSAPDGYTLCVTSTDGTVKLLQGKGTSPVTEFTQISMLASQPVTLSVGPKFKGNSLKEFVDEAKKNPGTIAYASNGEGGATHFGMEIFAKQAGIQLNHIPYKGTAPALQDLVGGQIEATLVSLAGIGSQLQGGRARALAITSPKRVETAPNIPTFAEQGYPSFDLVLWYGMTGPKGLPEPIVRKINAALKDALSSPDVQKALRDATAEPIYSTPEQMLAFVQKEAARWSTMIK